jgi:peptidoglycan/LPS O-acetylase OafA/YrhL
MFLVVPSLGHAQAQTVFGKSSPWWAYPLFLQNFLVPSPTSAAGPLAVTWSLAIEEQFYLVWPLIVRYWSARAIRRGAIAAICVSPVLRLYLGALGVNLYTSVFCRLDGLMAGALLAVTVRTDGFEPAVFVRRAWVALAVSLPLAFAFEAAHARWIVFSLSAAASAAFVFVALFSRQAGLRMLMTNRFLVYTGTISYGLYLLHKIPFDIAKTLRLDAHPVVGLATLVAAGYAMAAVSWNLLEKPYLRLKRYFVPSTASRASRATATNRSTSASVMTSGGAKSTMSPGIG